MCKAIDEEGCANIVCIANIFSPIPVVALAYCAYLVALPSTIYFIINIK
jgi:hypothetical protein